MILIYLFILIITLIHYLRWFAIIQQKEYRLDRYILFLKSKEGIRDIFLPFPISFSLPQKTDFKRPKLTAKITLIALITLALILFSFYKAFYQNQVDFNIFLLFLYLKAPTSIFIASLPTTLLTKIITAIEIKKAQKKIAKIQPIIIGITGSYGKSSTKFLVKHLLSQSQKVFATPNSFNTIYSVSHSINQNYQDQTIMILEYGAYTQNEIKILAKHFKPCLAIITGITHQHLGLFKSLENIKKAKEEIIKALPQNGTVFFNGEDKNVLDMVLSFSLTKIDYAKIKISNPSLNKKAQLDFEYSGKKISSQLIGKHYLNNVKAAISIAKFLQIPENIIVKALTNFQPNQIFISSKITKSGTLIIDDGKTSNPEGFRKAIKITESLKSQFPKKQIILLTSGIVDLGNKSKQIHTQLAQKGYNVFYKVLYTEIIGKKEFSEIFKTNLIFNKIQIIKELKRLDKNSILLIEGKIKTDILKHLS